MSTLLIVAAIVPPRETDLLSPVQAARIHAPGSLCVSVYRQPLLGIGLIAIAETIPSYHPPLTIHSPKIGTRREFVFTDDKWLATFPFFFSSHLRPAGAKRAREFRSQFITRRAGKSFNFLVVFLRGEPPLRRAIALTSNTSVDFVNSFCSFATKQVRFRS